MLFLTGLLGEMWDNLLSEINAIFDSKMDEIFSRLPKIESDHFGSRF